jgi:hypothetical protein
MTSPDPWTSMRFISFEPAIDGDDEDLLGYVEAELQPHDIVLRCPVIRVDGKTQIGGPALVSIGGVSLEEAIQRSGLSEIERQLGEIGLVWRA